jgi:glycosyltransferase involved in cell wall biosynthesis
MSALAQASADTRIWVNVTTTLQWKRPPVGIVRVEQEYCRWLLAQDVFTTGSVRLCRYDRYAGQFFEVSPQQLADALRPVAAPTVSTAAPDRKRRITAWLLRLVPYLPAPWVPVLKVRVRRLQATLIDLRARLRDGVQRGRAWARRRESGSPAHTARPAAFAAGDRFVSLGLDWDHLDQAHLYRLKQQHQLRVTLICYDVIPVLRPHLVVLPPGGFGAYVVDMAWCADAILCISEHTRRDCEGLLRQLGVPVPPTHVIRLGAQIKGDAQGAAPAGLRHGPGERPFVLFVSTIERRKNHEILYRAWTRLREQGIEPYRLVFVGMPGWGVNDLLNDLRLDPRTRDDIVCLNHVSDADLAWLYRHAAFTVFPSLYEGWGLPVVESLAWGRFCLASNTSSLPEAGGPWAEYLDPWDLPAWTERLAFFMQNPQEVHARNERIAREFVPPAWADTAASIHRIALEARA